MIYEICHRINDFAYFTLSKDSDQETLDHGYYNILSLAANWQPPEVAISQARKRLGDFPGFGGLALPVVSRAAWEVMQPLAPASTEALPLGTFKRAEYLVVNVLELVDAIDPERSTYSLTDAGEQFSLKEAAYKSGALEGHHLFRLLTHARIKYSWVLVSEEMKQTIEAAGLIGAEFVPFGVKKRPLEEQVLEDAPPLDRAEVEASLPAAYRELLTNYPPELVGNAADFELYANLEDAMELTRKMRALWPISDYRKRPLAESYFMIGEDGCGDLFALDLSLGDASPVMAFDHERGRWQPWAASLKEYVQQMLALAANEK